ncbi:MAG: methyl-accepting chemotaxis protein [Oligoflexales bacterium]
MGYIGGKVILVMMAVPLVLAAFYQVDLIVNNDIWMQSLKKGEVDPAWAIQQLELQRDVFWVMAGCLAISLFLLLVIFISHSKDGFLGHNLSKSSLHRLRQRMERLGVEVAKIENLFPFRVGGRTTAQSEKSLIYAESYLKSLKSFHGECIAAALTLEKLLTSVSQQNEHNTQQASRSKLEWLSLSGALKSLQQVRAESRNNFLILEKFWQTGEKENQALKSSSESLKEKLGVVAHHVDHFMGKSRKGDQILAGAHQDVDRCHQDVLQATELVNTLSHKAEEIANIIDIIDDIAEQTNLLALNASIEAARAGEQGQGFAVVADEVRKLAARSSTATRSITELLMTIKSEADEASHMLGKSSESSGVANTSIVRFTELFRESIQFIQKGHVSLHDTSGVLQNLIEHISSIQKQYQDINSTFKMQKHCIKEADEAGVQVHENFRSLNVVNDRLTRTLCRLSLDQEMSAELANSVLSMLHEMGPHTEKVQESLLKAASRGRYDDVGCEHKDILSDSLGAQHMLVAHCQRDLDILMNPGILSQKKSKTPTPKSTPPSPKNDSPSDGDGPEDDDLIIDRRLAS